MGPMFEGTTRRPSRPLLAQAGAVAMILGGVVVLFPRWVVLALTLDPPPNATTDAPLEFGWGGAALVVLGALATTWAEGVAARERPPRAEVVGFDASGLMVYAYAGVGVKLPRSSGEQYKVGQKVTPAQALPGDLIFYGPEGTQSVALFIGNGQMVETTDEGVAVSSVRTNDMTPYLVRIIA